MKLAWIFTVMLVGMMSRVSAQDAMVRAKLELKEGDPWVGQKVTLVMELLAPGYFSGSPAFELPRVPGVLVIPPSESPVLGTEQIGDTSYTVQRHELAVFGQRPGAHEIPAFPVRFGFKRSPLDKDAVPQRVMTKPLPFTTRMPPGAEKLGTIISARDLEVKETWQPEPGKTQAKAGDAFVRTITYTAPEVPGMAFPPFPTAQIDGLGLYPKTPQVLDRSERGSMQGERRDTINYQCKREGHFVIPAVRFTWWDLEAKELKVVNFPARSFDVAPNPAMASVAQADAATAQGSPLMIAAAWAIGMLAVMIVGFTLGMPYLAAAGAGVRLFFQPVHLQPLNPTTSVDQGHHNIREV